jgi:hypothetical protein
MPKASGADKEHFRSVLPDHPEVTVKPMFGNLGAFVNGNMFAGLFAPTIGVKLADADKEELESTERTVPFGPAAHQGWKATVERLMWEALRASPPTFMPSTFSTSARSFPDLV